LRRHASANSTTTTSTEARAAAVTARARARGGSSRGGRPPVRPPNRGGAPLPTAVGIHALTLSRVVCMGGAGTGRVAGGGAGRELLWCACRLGGSADTEDWLQSSPLAAAAPSAHQPVAALPARAAAARTGRAFSGEFSRHSSQSTVLQGGPRDRAEVGARGRAAEAPEEGCARACAQCSAIDPSVDAYIDG
jgi:hypothetical protein